MQFRIFAEEQQTQAESHIDRLVNMSSKVGINLKGLFHGSLEFTLLILSISRPYSQCVVPENIHTPHGGHSDLDPYLLGDIFKYLTLLKEPMTAIYRVRRKQKNK